MKFYRYQKRKPYRKQTRWLYKGSKWITRDHERFDALFDNKLTEDEARALLIELYERGENDEEIAATAGDAWTQCEAWFKCTLAWWNHDVVGTGGDKSGTFNISTTTSIVLASLGCKVAKHGSGSATQAVGSADVLKRLGLT